jgi:hypothetical protein
VAALWFLLPLAAANGQTREMPEFVGTRVEFQTSDPFLDSLYRAAGRVAKNNEQDFAGVPVLVEGGGYDAIWIETQPMGGEMYAKRNLRVAANNSLIFMTYQLLSGRYPGRIRCVDGVNVPAYTHLQGYCFPYHALNLYYWNKKKDKDYLHVLYRSIEAYDAYLWKYRDADGNGCLETWGVTDTGEDHASKFDGTTESKWHWPGETPPVKDPVFPIESMDMMSYSYDARTTLARISVLLGNGREKEWSDKANSVRDKIRSYLWDDKRGACFDRNRHNEMMPALTHNNLRAMYFGSFSQDMADRFVKEHLLNPDEFFTPMPLPSISVGDPLFRNISSNNWSGQPQGLTYQRAIRALENYGYYSEITLLGEKLINCVGKRNTFPQQFDPFTGEFSEASRVKEYGPTALSVLEYISRLYGIHVQFDEIYWGALGRDKQEISYTQYWAGDALSLHSKNGQTTGSINGNEIFRVTNGVRVVTDWKGGVSKIMNIKNIPVKVEYHISGRKNTVTLKPNQIMNL